MSKHNFFNDTEANFYAIILHLINYEFAYILMEQWTLG